MTEEQKSQFADLEYTFPGGESWLDTQKRGRSFIQGVSERYPGPGTHLVFTHGGVITSLLHHEGITEFPPPGSVVGVRAKEGLELEFVWEFPQVREDI